MNPPELDKLITQARYHIWESGWDDAGLGKGAGLTAALRANAEATLALAEAIRQATARELTI